MTIEKELLSRKDTERARVSQRFFKTGPGEYGEGDIFYGVSVPDCRRIAKKYYELPFAGVKELLFSKIHEERLVALFILVHTFQEGDEKKRREIFTFYVSHTKQVNNWDLVDSSADKIVGEYLKGKSRSLLFRLARSNNIWERRIAIIATFQFIKANEFGPTLQVARLLLNDTHDLIHKSAGWMLREIGKRSLKSEENFLREYHKKMPRTMLRYAIERFSDKKRKFYLK